MLGSRVDNDPARKGHETLKKGESPGDQKGSAAAHVRVLKGIGDGDGKGIHGKSDSEQGALYHKQQQIHSPPVMIRCRSIPDLCKKNCRLDPHFWFRSYSLTHRKSGTDRATVPDLQCRYWQIFRYRYSGHTLTGA